MKIIVDTDLIKSYVEDNHVLDVICDGESLGSLLIDGETIWYPCYKGHTEVIDEAVAPTCTESGLTEGSHCSICGATVVAQEFVPATGHKYSSVLQAATCTEPGLETHTCIYCDDSYEVTLDPLGHDYGDWDITLEPTCLLAGSKRRDCRRSMCDHYETETIPALGHNPVPILKVWPTCTETGLTEGSKCMTCGTVLEVQRPIPALGHTLGEWIIDTEPTVNSTGSRHKECTFCGEVIETEVIPKLDSLTYTLSSDGTYYSVKAANTDIRSNTDTDGLIRIPSDYNGIPVMKIDTGAFEDCLKINRVIIPDSITSIGAWAFDNAGITTVTIPNSVIEIRTSAFGDCSALKSAYFDPNSQLTSIGNGAFEGCLTLSGIEIPDSVTSIGDRAFKGCPLNAGVKIGNGVTSIGDEAFYDCDFTNIEIPDGVTTIGERAFMFSSLKKITIPASVTHIGSQAFGSINLLEAQITLLNKDCWKTTKTLTDGTLEDVYIDVDAHTSLEMGALLANWYSYYEWNATEHVYGDWYVINEPTCVATGLKGRNCVNCGHYETDIVPISDEHAYESVVTAPTCTEQGYTTHTCKVCGRTYIDSHVPALGHSYISSVTPPTCTTQGYTTHTCTRCGDSYTDTIVPATGHNWKDATCTTPKTCKTCGVTEGSALGHTEVIDPAVAATCTTAGKTEGKHCSVCGTVIVAQTRIDPLGHNYSTTKVGATCTEQGYDLHTCATCGISYKDNYTDAPGHKYGDWVETTAPTCTATGIQRRDCSRCDAYETQTIAALGHKYSSVVTAPTCTAQGYTTHTCSTCGDSYVDTYTAATGHKWSAWSITSPTCTRAGNKRRTCSVCSAIDTELVPATGHTWEAATCTTPKTCSVCGATEGTTASHTEVSYPNVNPTYTTVGYRGGSYCSVCGTVLTARTKILATPEITDAVMSEGNGGVEITVRNNNSVQVYGYVSIYDDVGTNLYDGQFQIRANSSEYLEIPVNSSHVNPLEISVYFEASGYEDSYEETVILD